MKPYGYIDRYGTDKEILVLSFDTKIWQDMQIQGFKGGELSLCCLENSIFMYWNTHILYNCRTRGSAL